MLKQAILVWDLRTTLSAPVDRKRISDSYADPFWVSTTETTVSVQVLVADTSTWWHLKNPNSVVFERIMRCTDFFSFLSWVVNNSRILREEKERVIGSISFLVSSSFKRLKYLASLFATKQWGSRPTTYKIRKSSKNIQCYLTLYPIPDIDKKNAIPGRFRIP